MGGCYCTGNTTTCSLFVSSLVAVSTFDPLPHFYPIVEFRDRIDHWKWMGGCGHLGVVGVVTFGWWVWSVFGGVVNCIKILELIITQYSNNRRSGIFD